jgi:hypothetical protein
MLNDPKSLNAALLPFEVDDGSHSSASYGSFVYVFVVLKKIHNTSIPIIFIYKAGVNVSLMKCLLRVDSIQNILLLYLVERLNEVRDMFNGCWMIELSCYLFVYLFCNFDNNMPCMISSKVGGRTRYG